MQGPASCLKEQGTETQFPPKAIVKGGRLRGTAAVKSEKVTVQAVICRAETWKPRLEPQERSGSRLLNARAVEFIAKPGKIRQLQCCVREGIMRALENCVEFSSALLLTSHKEPRLVVVLTFWSSKEAALNNRWEEIPEIQQMVFPMIDKCCNVHSYEAVLPEPLTTDIEYRDDQAC
jgi:hypothetical protein